MAVAHLLVGLLEMSDGLQQFASLTIDCDDSAVGVLVGLHLRASRRLQPEAAKGAPNVHRP